MSEIGSDLHDLVVQRVSASSQGTVVIPWPDRDPPTVVVKKNPPRATAKEV